MMKEHSCTTLFQKIWKSIILQEKLNERILFFLVEEAAFGNIHMDWRGQHPTSDTIVTGGPRSGWLKEHQTKHKYVFTKFIYTVHSSHSYLIDFPTWSLVWFSKLSLGTNNETIYNDKSEV